jgi:hypothetical protein
MWVEGGAQKLIRDTGDAVIKGMAGHGLAAR